MLLALLFPGGLPPILHHLISKCRPLHTFSQPQGHQNQIEIWILSGRPRKSASEDYAPDNRKRSFLTGPSAYDATTPAS